MSPVSPEAWRRCHPPRLEFYSTASSRTGDQLRTDCARRWSSRPAQPTACRHPQSGHRVKDAAAAVSEIWKAALMEQGFRIDATRPSFLTATLAIPGSQRGTSTAPGAACMSIDPLLVWLESSALSEWVVGS